MSGGKVPKKWDFFSKGRGIDHFNDDSMDNSSSSPNQNEGHNVNEYQAFDKPSSSTMYGLELQSYNSPTCSPSSSYPQSPSPTQYTLCNSNSHALPSITPYNNQSNFLYMPQHSSQSPLMPSSSSHLSHMYPQIGSMPGMVPLHPMCPEPPYGSCIATDMFSPLRPMNTNGIHSVVELCDPSPVTSRNEGATGIFDLNESQKKKRKQECSLCLNHNLHVEVKGHKWFCPRRKCDCERCEITRGRQHHMKEQQKLTRALNRNTNPM